MKISKIVILAIKELIGSKPAMNQPKLAYMCCTLLQLALGSCDSSQAEK